MKTNNNINTYIEHMLRFVRNCTSMPNWGDDVYTMSFHVFILNSWTKRNESNFLNVTEPD